MSDVRANWWWVLDRVRHVSPTTEVLLRHARLETVEGDEVVLSWPWRFHRDTVDQPGRRALIEGVMLDVLGKPYRLRCIQADP